ncbi:MAG: thioredoxin domain-containing protein [bacterium]|nr:MAG: thioredoxin domain-containing protein [bacterium]
MLEKYPRKVRLVFKNFPLRNHKLALPAAQAALAAGRQGKFWEYHDKTFLKYNQLTEELLDQFARELGLDMTRFNKDRKDPDITSLINRDLREGSRIGVRGTPTIFVNGKRLDQRSLEGFSAAIESELDSQKK